MENSESQQQQQQSQSQQELNIQINLDKYRQQQIKQAQQLKAQQQAQSQQSQETPEQLQQQIPQSKQAQQQKAPKHHPGFRPPSVNDEEAQQKYAQKMVLTEEQKRHYAEQDKLIGEKFQALSRPNFTYLDIFEQEMKERKQASDEFYLEKKQQDSDYEQNKPAMFRKSAIRNEAMYDQIATTQEEKLKQKPWKEQEFEAWKKLQEQTKMDFDPDEKSQDELREFFKISKEKNALDHMNSQVFEYLYERMKERQIKFYAFLNKEFNIMNFKSARCSMYCFESIDKSVSEVNDCLKLCREGIQGCKQFAHNLQKKAEVEVETCQNEAKEMKKLTDPIFHWISCYEKLILRFDSMEEDIKHEFSNFI